MLIVLQERHGGVRRNANGARNLFAPMEIGEKVLAEALACHAGNSVAGGVETSERWPSERPGRVGVSGFGCCGIARIDLNWAWGTRKNAGFLARRCCKHAGAQGPRIGTTRRGGGSDVRGDQLFALLDKDGVKGWCKMWS